jgi:uncharacterized damage-inducible protein DinB
MISDIQHEFQQYRRLAEQAMEALDDDAFFRRPAEQVNPVALIVKHLAGNLQSRWSDFLTSDGEKQSRNRDDEFLLKEGDNRGHLMAQWAAGWGVLEKTLGSLQPADLQKTITIRGEKHSVQQALLRGMGHAAYHAGQILYLARVWKADAPWLTIAPGHSAAHRPTYRKP